MWIRGYIAPALLVLALGAGTVILFLVEAENRVSLLELMRRCLHDG
jgi:hypothetical protein